MTIERIIHELNVKQTSPLGLVIEDDNESPVLVSKPKEKAAIEADEVEGIEPVLVNAINASLALLIVTFGYFFFIDHHAVFAQANSTTFGQLKAVLFNAKILL